MKTKFEDKLIRCPKLGDEMTFSYCLQEAENLPCSRIITCWQAAFDVAQVLRECLTPAQWDGFSSAGPKDKVTCLIELIEKTKRQT